MGTEYYAINKRTKTFYDLGKGGWYALTDMEAFQDEEYLCNEILTECYYIDDDSYWNGTDIDKRKTIDYIKNRVSPQLFEMMRDTPPDKIAIISDSRDDITFCKAKGYICIGTRYHEIDSDEYKDRMLFENRHLEDTPLNKRGYNPENYTSYPGFNDY